MHSVTIFSNFMIGIILFFDNTLEQISKSTCSYYKWSHCVMLKKLDFKVLYNLQVTDLENHYI